MTSLPAKAYGLTSDLGTLEKGKLADLILVSGDPLRNIDDLANVECVMKNGVLRSVSEIAKPFAQLPTGQTVCPAPRNCAPWLRCQHRCGATLILISKRLSQCRSQMDSQSRNKTDQGNCFGVRVTFCSAFCAAR